MATRGITVFSRMSWPSSFQECWPINFTDTSLSKKPLRNRFFCLFWFPLFYIYYQLTGTSEEQLHTQFEGDADKRVRTNLVIEAVAAAENFVTTQDEIDTEISELAESYNMPKEEVMKLLPTDMLKHDIAAKKAVEVITSTVVVK